MIPQFFIQDLLARVDIVAIIERYLPLKKGGANYFACCPFHSEKSASFSVSPSKQFYHCFGCGKHGSAIGFLMEYSGLSYVEAIQEIARDAGIQVPDDGRNAARTDDSLDRLIEIMAAAAEFYRGALKDSSAAATYLRKRGLTPDIAARFGIGFAPDAQTSLQQVFQNYQDKRLNAAGLVIDNDQGRRYDRFRNRIIFPIHDRRGRVIAFGGRILDRGEPKYLNSPETPLFEKGRELYGFFLAQKAIRATGFALVVEGYMDVVALAQFGMENAVATLGTATTPHHIQTLLRQTNRVVFCFDGDAPGRLAAWRALENALGALRDDATLAFLFLPPEHDPDTFIREKGLDAMRQAAATATPLATFLLDTLRQRCDTTNAEGRARLPVEAKPLIARFPEAASGLRLQLIKAIAAASRITQGEAEQALGIQPARRMDADARTGSRQQAPQTRRPPPSPAATLLRLVLQHPSLAERLPINLIPDDTDEGRALIAIIDLAELGEAVTNFGALSERFRDTPHGETLERVAARSIENEFDPSVIDSLFQDTLRKLQLDAIEKEIAELKERNLLVGALTPAEQHRLANLLKEKNCPAGFVKPSDLR
ncbi:MAG: DNA primase [Azoarcus sp.]|jgi:DNA primase|nr:DNA primase [Azoarcus sp.]